MSQPQRPPMNANSRSRPSWGVLGFVIRMVLTGGGLFVFLYLFGFLPSFNGPKAQVKPADATEAAPPKGVEEVTTASIQKQQLALAKVAQRQAVASYEQLKRTLDEWEKALTDWEQEGPALLKNETGKKLAADKTQVSRFRGLNKVNRPSRDQLTTARQTAEDLVRPIRDSLANPEDASMPDGSITGSLEKLASDAKQARDGYRQATNAVRAMLAQVKDTAPSQKTLEEAIATLDQDDDAQRLAVIDAEERKAKDDGAKKVAAEKAKLEEAKADAETRRIQDMAAKQKQEADLAAARTVEEMKLKQKEIDQEIARREAIKEQTRQGDLKSGSVWKGSFRDDQGFTYEATMTIDSRVKDDIRGSIKATSGAAGNRTYTFKGKVNGTTLKLSPVGGGSEANDNTCKYDPSNKTIIGGGTYQTYTLMLSNDKDE